MAALPKPDRHQLDRFLVPAAPTVKPRPRLAIRSDLGGMNSALAAQRSQLEALVRDHEPAVDRYSGPVRLVIILGGSAALWAVIAVGLWRLVAAL